MRPNRAVAAPTPGCRRIVANIRRVRHPADVRRTSRDWESFVTPKPAAYRATTAWDRFFTHVTSTRRPSVILQTLTCGASRSGAAGTISSRFAPIRQRQLAKAVRRKSARLRSRQFGVVYRHRRRVWSPRCAGPLAQLVEHSTFNRVVEGSIPSRPTTNTLKKVTILKPCHRSSARLPALAAPLPALSGNGADGRNRTHPGHRDLNPSCRPVEPGPMTEPPHFP